jgi:hypothetical protein
VIGTKPKCVWCGSAFTPRSSGGSPQRFCCPSHRHRFGGAARKWALTLIDARLINVEVLKATHYAAQEITDS